MYYIRQKTFTYRCDAEADMDSVREKVCHENPGFSVVKEKKDYKTKKSKGEIVDEFWLYSVTIDSDDEI